MYPFVLHGSADSVDIDAHFLIPKVLLRPEAKALCDSIDTANANLIVVQDGIVTWCYKGPVDEVNNGLLKTYGLHKQQYPCPVTRLVYRNKAVKAVRVVRGILGQFTRTPFREDVKEALRSNSFEHKLKTIIRLSTVDGLFTYVPSEKVLDIKKFVAFQIVQMLALLGDEEVFTKAHAAEFSKSMRPFLYREINSDSSQLLIYMGYLARLLSDEFVQEGEIVSNNSFDKSSANIKTELPHVETYK